MQFEETQYQIIFQILSLHIDVKKLEGDLLCMMVDFSLTTAFCYALFLLQ